MCNQQPPPTSPIIHLECAWRVRFCHVTSQKPTRPMLFYNSALLARRLVAASCGGAHGVRKRALSSSSSTRSEDERQRGRREVPPPLPETEDPFVILNVKIDATEAEIKTRFYHLAKQVHPDAAPQTHRTDALKAAADFHKLVSNGR
jgi:hypothetical protein